MTRAHVWCLSFTVAALFFCVAVLSIQVLAIGDAVGGLLLHETRDLSHNIGPEGLSRAFFRSAIGNAVLIHYVNLHTEEKRGRERAHQEWLNDLQESNRKRAIELGWNAEKGRWEEEEKKKLDN